MDDEDRGPRQEDMEIAAKVAIMADEFRQILTLSDEDNNEGKADDDEQNEIERDSSRQEPQNYRHQSTRRRDPAEGWDEVKDTEDPPSVIAVNEQPDCDTLLTSYDIDTITQSIPFALANLVQESGNMSADALDERFKQITDMLICLQQRQIETFEGQNHVGRDDPNGASPSGSMRYEANTSTTSQQSNASSTDRNVSEGANVDSFPRVGMEPSGSFLGEIPAAPRGDAPPSFASIPEPPPRPDPPAMQVLIEDLMRKCDRPDGDIQASDVNAWFQERLTPAVGSTLQRSSSHRLEPEDQGDGFPPDLDRKLPARPSTTNNSDILDATEIDIQDPRIGLGLNDESDAEARRLLQSTAAPAAEENTPEARRFNEQWQRAVAMVQSACNSNEADRNGEGDEMRSASRRPTSANDAAAVDNNDDQQPVAGAIRMIGPGARHSDIADDGDDDQQQEEEGPVTAHAVISEDVQDAAIQKLNKAVNELQQKQAIIDATSIQKADPIVVDKVNDEDDEDDDEPTFLESYGDGLLIACLAFGVGIFLGLRMRSSTTRG